MPIICFNATLSLRACSYALQMLVCTTCQFFLMFLLNKHQNEETVIFTV